MTDKLSREEWLAEAFCALKEKYQNPRQAKFCPEIDEAYNSIKALLTPVPGEDVEKFIEKWIEEWHFYTNWEEGLYEDEVEEKIKEMLQAWDNLREGKEG